MSEMKKLFFYFRLYVQIVITKNKFPLFTLFLTLV